MYTGEQVLILGTLMTHALYKEQSHCLPLYVVKGNGPSLLGRDWLNFFRLDWKEICTLHQPSKLDRILKKYAQVFGPSLATFHGVSVDIETYPLLILKPILRRLLNFSKHSQYLSSIERKLKRN